MPVKKPCHCTVGDAVTDQHDEEEEVEQEQEDGVALSLKQSWYSTHPLLYCIVLDVRAEHKKFNCATIALLYYWRHYKLFCHALLPQFDDLSKLCVWDVGSLTLALYLNIVLYMIMRRATEPYSTLCGEMQTTSSYKYRV